MSASEVNCADSVRCNATTLTPALSNISLSRGLGISAFPGRSQKRTRDVQGSETEALRSTCVMMAAKVGRGQRAPCLSWAFDAPVRMTVCFS